MKTRPIQIVLGMAAITVAVTHFQYRAIANLKSDSLQLASRLESLKKERVAVENQTQEMAARQEKTMKETQHLGEVLDRIVQGIKKAREESMEPLVTWKDNVDYVDIPKQFLQSLHLSAYESDEEGNFHIADNVATMLGMTREERTRTQDVLTRARSRYHAKEKDLLQSGAELNPNDGPSKNWQNRTTFFVPAYAEESQAFQAHYKNDLQSILGETRTALILKYATYGGIGGVSEYHDFTDMGFHDRSITIGLDPKDPMTNQWHFVDWAKDSYTLTGGMGIGDAPTQIPAGWKHLLSPDTLAKSAY